MSLPPRQCEVAAQLKPGDVVSYLPRWSHARERTAYVLENGKAVDTFWHTFAHDGALLNEEELATAEVRFNVGDYEALDRYAATSRAKWETFHPSDRGRITSQHGLQEALYLRRGAKPHLDTQIENARRRVELAERDLRTAEWRLDGRRQELAELEASA